MRTPCDRAARNYRINLICTFAPTLKALVGSDFNKGPDPPSGVAVEGVERNNLHTADGLNLPPNNMIIGKHRILRNVGLGLLPYH